MRTNRNYILSGFTIVELLVVIVVIGILATIIFLFYRNITAKAIDISVISDVSSLDKQERIYLISNDIPVSYYSGSNGTYDSSLNFRPSKGNFIDVVTGGINYCIRGYSTAGTYNSVNNAYKKESSIGVCDALTPSAGAIADSPSGGEEGGGGGSLSSGWKQISSGGDVTCGIDFDDKVYCWGVGDDGQLGNGTNDKSNIPVAVSTSGVLGGKTIKQISVGGFHACAIASDDMGYCWGYNYDGELGIGTNVDSNIPVAINTSGVLNGKTIKQVSASDYHTCAIASDDKAYCWGDGGDGEFGNGTNSESNIPVAVSTSGVLSGKTIKQISSGYRHTCAIASDDKAYCWGSNWIGQLGDSSNDDSNIPVAVSTSGVLSGKTIKSISAVSYNTCVVASDDKAYCWGDNSMGQLGDGNVGESYIPVAVSTSGVLSGKTFESISAGNEHTCAIASDKKAYCWGGNAYGELGDDTYDDSYVPVAVYASGVLNGKTIKSMSVSISGGTYRTCAIASDDEAYCWGDNFEGQLGDATNDESNVPVLVVSGKAWTRLEVGDYYTCAETPLSTVYCWGDGSNGALGNNSDSSGVLTATPLDTSGVLNGKTIKSIATNDWHTCAIASNNLAYCWGADNNMHTNHGELGNNNAIGSLVPVTVDATGALSGTTIRSLSLGDDHTCAIASNNLAYCWGYNDNTLHGTFSRLGINDSSVQSQVPLAVYTGGVLSGKTFKSISAGYEHTCAIASDNKAYCWGRNNNGQLGDGTYTNSLAPVAVSTAGILSGKTIKSISAGENHTCAIASDEKVYCWGSGSSGELGDGLETKSNIPVAIDTSGVLNGKTVKSISAGGWHTCVVASDRQAYCWGSDWSGELGDATDEYGQSNVPVAVVTSGVLSGKTIKTVSVGEYHSCAIASDNQIYCWGWNSDGQLGDKTTNDSNVPVAAQSL